MDASEPPHPRRMTVSLPAVGGCGIRAHPPLRVGHPRCPARRWAGVVSTHGDGGVWHPHTPPIAPHRAAAVVLAALAFLGVISAAARQLSQAEVPPDDKQPKSREDQQFIEARQRMVERDLRGRDIKDKRVLEAMARVPRHRFVPEELQRVAYEDYPLPIGHGQTISQPYVVALMTQLAQPKPKSRALDIGTGSGYQAAVLAEVCKEVYTIEIIKPLADEAEERLRALGYKNVQVRCGDGYQGWPKHAPFDVIIVAAAPDHVPQPLLDQLAPGGRMVIPVGRWFQELIVIEKRRDGTLRRQSVAPVAFVPMTGEAEKRERE
jgi:protein-L-isoaspartate(D-aspartate) O-methyltransferase